MNRLINFLFFSIFILPPLFAAKVMNEPNSYWKCAVYDTGDKQWSAVSAYRLSALNKAYDACKKQSDLPTSCSAVNENCEIYINGFTTRPMWQCTSLDFYASPHTSSVYKQQYDAALAALTHCEDNSHYPDSCYVNLIGCENLNKRS